jgi:phytoene desaturase
MAKGKKQFVVPASAGNSSARKSPAEAGTTNLNRKRAVIIGGGLGGLAAGLRLAAQGWNVTICEAGATWGGKMNTWSERGFCFDTGPSLITLPWIFAELFEALGERIEEHLELIRLHPLAAYSFDDGTRFIHTTQMPDWLGTVRALDRRDVSGFLRFMELGSRLYEVSKDTFLRRPPFARPQFSDLARARQMPFRYAWGNYHHTVAAHFRSPHLRQMFDRYPTYVGSSPYRSPATLALIPFIEFTFGGWYIKGGLYRLIETLIELAGKLRITLLLNSEAQHIETDGDRASGVRLGDGTKLPADVVVMNGDASHVAGMINGRASPLPPLDRSLSGLVFLFGIGREAPELSHHQVFFSADYQREFAQLFDERRFPDDPTVYVNAPSRTDRSIVPGAGEVLFVMANAPASDTDEWNETEISEARRRVMTRLRRGGFPEIENDIVVSDVFTPRRLATRYLMPGGAIYGTHSHGWRRAFLRPPNKDRKYRGLYYVGGSTHPGGGAPIVLRSAQIVTELIGRHERA